MLNRSPRFCGTQTPGHSPGESHLRSLSEAQAAVGFPKSLGRNLQSNFHCPDVRRLGNDLRDSEQTEVSCITDLSIRHNDAARRSFNQTVRTHNTHIQSFGYGKRLHNGTGLVGIGHHTVADLVKSESAAVVGVKSRPTDQSQNFSSNGISHHHCTGLGLVFFNRIAHRRIGNVLNSGVNR